MDKHFTEDGLLKSPSLIHCVVYHSTLIEHDRIKQNKYANCGRCTTTEINYYYYYYYYYYVPWDGLERTVTCASLVSALRVAALNVSRRVNGLALLAMAPLSLLK